MEKICVAVRLRPPVSTSPDPFSNGFFWRVENNRVSLHKSHGSPITSLSYAFDHVFDESSSNGTVYELLTKDIIHAAVDGFNGTAFAYGQTSSGKTFTMNGSENDPGIIFRAVKDVFDNIEKTSDREFLIRVSYMEIYNEEINDLFAVENQKLPIHESLERGIFVAGLREEIVSNAEQVLKLIESGEVNRHFGDTNMNARSSRSHTIFRMVIESKGKETSNDAIRVSVLNLVDLAGSERIAKTGADGVRLKEGKYINKSLMVLGNVINKLSDGAKQRAHIPYRDSKLTRILQPALGGNAKTSIICTIAPEEVHIEETKGTLQFASRAKRITNCAQVNEILTDAALLKRQKLEIEELRMKLQGSRSEVLEQEILKLRNEMLKYELEREKLETELEVERRSQKERDQCIREQQLKIDNLSSLVTSTDSDRSCSQGKNFEKQFTKEDFNNSGKSCHEDIFETPTFKAGPNSFVAKRSNYTRMPDCSPLPDAFSNFADEDTWMKMNKGYIADLDSIQMTPARKVQSFPPSSSTPGCSNENDEQDVLNLKRQLELIAEEKKELEKKHMEQLRLNDTLMKEVSQLKQEAGLLGKIPQKLHVSVVSSKRLYEEASSNLQLLVPDGKSSTAKLLNETSNIGITLFSNLEAFCSMAKDSQECTEGNDLAVQEQCKLLSDNLKDTIASLASSEALAIQNKDKGSTWGDDLEQTLRDELNTLQEKCKRLEQELDLNSQLVEESRQKYTSLESDFQILKAERDSLLEALSKSSHKLALITDQKENVLKDLNAEAQRRKDLEEEIKQFSVAFSSRQRSLLSFHNEFRSKIEKLRAENGVPLSKSLGC